MESEKNIKDPLGEIERLAKRLWEERGRAAETSWKDFFAEAENQLLAGLGERRRDDAVKPTPLEAGAPAPAGPIPRFPGIAALLHLEQGLNFHESYCLAKLLVWNRFRTTPDGRFQSCSKTDIAELLTILAVEYEDGLFNGKSNLQAVPPEQLRSHWLNKIEQWEREDAPLGYSDRNTLERVKDMLIDRGLFSEMRLKEE